MKKCAGNILMEKTGSTVDKIYLWGNGIEALIVPDGSDIQFYGYLKNAHGDVLTVSQGFYNYAEYDYDAYGNVVACTETGITNPIRYAGYYYDTDTQNYYLKNRYYSPYQGRFLTEDTYWNVSNMLFWKFTDTVEKRVYYPAIVQSANRFAYCLNNPIGWYDPWGLVVTAWDEDHLTDKELELLEQYTQDWISANEDGDEYGMYRAHANAEDLRRKYRELDEITLDNGFTGTVSLDEDLHRVFTYVEREKKSEDNISLAEVILRIACLPLMLTSCSHTDREEYVKELRLSGNAASTIPTFDWNSPAISPGIGWEWRGKTPVGGAYGGWYNPATGESLHPDLSHPDGVDSHWDYTDPNKNVYRIYSDGTIERKK